MFELMDDAQEQRAVIKVVGVGGGGSNAVDHMVSQSVEGVEFICANTDAQALKKSATRSVVQIGSHITKGLGAGANPEVGRQAALEDRERIQEASGPRRKRRIPSSATSWAVSGGNRNSARRARS